jgi:hypothetical protein
MAFMSPPVSASGEFVPILAYDARAGRMFLRNRVQNSAGDWKAQETDVTVAQPAFAVDFGRLEVGWCHFVKGQAPQWNMVPYGHPIPDRPPSPGKDDEGKDLNFRNGFRVPVAGNAIGGVRELAGNSAALINGMNELHTQFEASAEAAMGKLPVVKMVNTISVKSGQANNYQPVFAIQTWVDRPDVLGPRTVPAPRAVNGHVPPATPAVNWHVPPVTPAAPAPVVAVPVTPSPVAQPGAAAPGGMSF